MATIKCRRTRPRAAAAGFGFVLLSLASTVEAAPITITDVRVVIGPMTYTAATVGWTFPYTLQPGQDLVLTQSFNGPPNDSASYNFDTSDIVGAQNFPQVFITANGVTTQFSDAGQVLNTRGVDQITNEDNEAQHYSLPIDGPGYQVFFGYADNAHTDACGAWASSVGLNGSDTCFPIPFFQSEGVDFFDGAGALLPAVLFPNSMPFHCPPGLPTCYEGGVIRIQATQDTVPEPATMTLLLTGGALIAGRQYRQRRKQLRG